MGGGGDHPGNFTSSVSNVPALSATGSQSANGVFGTTDSGVGVLGTISGIGVAVQGQAFVPTSVAVQGLNNGNIAGNLPGAPELFIAVQGQTYGGIGVQGVAFTSGQPPIQAFGTGVQGEGSIGVHGKGPVAGFFEGDVKVTGDVILTGADCAEEFDTAETAEIEPGTVMVLDQDGALHQSQHAYDKRVAGVISGAGDYRPGLILDRQQSQDHRIPVALVGKVYCKVDAQYAPIDVGDLLTTSPTSGHAMKADDPFKAFGSVIGKALRSLEAGQGMIPILIALQ